MLKLFAVTSWETRCGIAEYAECLRTAWEIKKVPLRPIFSSAALDPEQCIPDIAANRDQVDLVWLNHHAALHSRWTPDHIRQLQSMGIPVVATLHDTTDGSVNAPTSGQLRMIWSQANATIVHEPVEDLPGSILIRHGIPDPQMPIQYGKGSGGGYLFRAHVGQRTLGTFGFNFPWKNFDRLAELTARVGWAIVILSGNATEEDEARWRRLNPSSLVIRDYLSTPLLVSHLAGCDVTAFPYECANTGTSGAIRLGIAARRPVLAFSTCRQFRDLLVAEQVEGTAAIRWVENWDEIETRLKYLQPMSAIDGPTAWLAWRDQWLHQGMRYWLVFDDTLSTFRRLRS